MPAMRKRYGFPPQGMEGVLPRLPGEKAPRSKDKSKRQAGDDPKRARKESAGMKREKQIGWWCRKCERIMHMQQSDCRCMTQIAESACAAYRKRWLLPARVTLVATMESANR